MEQPDDDIRYRDLRALAVEQHREIEKRLDLHGHALGLLLGLITGQPVMTDVLRKALDELGFQPASPLLAPGAIIGKPS